MTRDKPDQMEARRPMPPTAARRATPHSAAVDPIEAGLRELFRAMAEEPLPEEFKALLDRIDAAAGPAAGPAAETAGSDSGDRR
jgi:hypothetical protein